VFEDDELKDKTTAAVEKQIHYGDTTDAGAKSDLNQGQVHTKEVV
jgi:hypothetical protein